VQRLSAPPPPRLSALAPRRDAYADLLQDSRGLRREQQQAREGWLSTLSTERKELVFELEVLLKGAACFANPRNHPGRPRRVPVVAQDFREPLSLLCKGFKRTTQLARFCLGERDKAFVFHRYLETLLPEDAARTRLLREDTSQDTPEGSLFALRRGFSNLAEVCDGLLRLPRVPFRLFYATASLAQREVSQNAFFNPLSALEFRPEFDRIQSSEVIEIIEHVPGEHAQRLVSLTFLSLFRMLRYLRLLEQIAPDLSDPLGSAAGRIYLVLSVLRSDARALARYLRRKSGEQLASSYEHDLLRTPASQIGSRYEELLASGHRLIDVRGAFECVSANIRLEMRRAFEHGFPSPDDGSVSTQLRDNVVQCVSMLRPALQNVILFLGQMLGTTLEEGVVFDDHSAKRQISERLRQHVWMFAQIVRAFTAKARHARGTGDAWSTVTSFQFVREFLAYFRAMGYPLLRASDYPRFAAFLHAMNALQDADLMDPDKLERAMMECDAFHAFLTELLDRIGHRDELRGVVFDKRAAAMALRLYLGE